MARGRPKTFDEDAALDAALTVLWDKGVSGVSLNELSARIGVVKPILARAFGDKDALIAKALTRYYEVFGEPVVAAIADATTPWDVAARYLDYFLKAQTHPDTPRGCLLASAVCDCAAIKEGPIREAIDNLNRRGHTALVEKLAATGERRPEELATFLAGQTMAMSTMARNGAERAELAVFVGLALKAVDDA